MLKNSTDRAATPSSRRLRALDSLKFFLSLAALAVVAFAVFYFAMPETRPASENAPA